MKNTTFIGNEAGQDGLAIFSIAVLEDSFNLIFANNTLHCPKGEYGYDKSADEVRRGKAWKARGIFFPLV